MFLQRRKFVVESRASKKKYTFIMERSKIAKYLCNLCSAQHKFNNEMNSRQLTHSQISGQLLYHDDCHGPILGCRKHCAIFCRPQKTLVKRLNWNLFCCLVTSPVDPSVFFPLEESIVQYATVCRAQSSRLKSFSCSEMPQNDSGLTTPQDESLTKLCDDVASRIEARIKQQRQSLNEQRFLFRLPAQNVPD